MKLQNRQASKLWIKLEGESRNITWEKSSMSAARLVDVRKTAATRKQPPERIITTHPCPGTQPLVVVSGDLLVVFLWDSAKNVPPPPAPTVVTSQQWSLTIPPLPSTTI